MFLSGIRLHRTLCLALAFRACFGRIVRAIALVHLAAAYSFLFTSYGVLPTSFHRHAHVEKSISLAAISSWSRRCVPEKMMEWPATNTQWWHLQSPRVQATVTPQWCAYHTQMSSGPHHGRFWANALHKNKWFHSAHDAAQRAARKHRESMDIARTRQSCRRFGFPLPMFGKAPHLTIRVTSATCCDFSFTSSNAVPINSMRSSFFTPLPLILAV